MNYSIYVESTPNPEVMKFVSNRMLADKSIEIATLEEAKGISIAEELLKFPFVKSIYLSSNFISISKIGTIEWENISIQLNSQESFLYNVVWTDPPREMLCLEPWTSPRNALINGDNILTLEPNKEIQLKFQLLVNEIH